MKKTLLLLALMVSFLAAPTAFACSPAMDWPPTAVENLAQQDIAFIGTVERISQDKSVNGEYRITFSVNETYKGDLGDTITVRAQSSSAACGYDEGYDTFKDASVWAIYANGDSEEGYRTDSLSLNTKYASVDAAESALKKLGIRADEGPVMCTMQYAPVCGRSLDGTVKTYGNACTLAAEKAQSLYTGECTVTVGSSMPTQDLWQGLRNADVTWLQNHLIEKLTGTAASALQAVGATGYFGQLTKAALAEFQAARGITPASGYYGAKTRAALSESPLPAPTFTGTISAVKTDCFFDGVCSVTIDDKEVIILTGMRIDVPPVGTLKGVESIGDLEGRIGDRAEVYAAKTDGGDEDFTLYGDASYYVNVLGK
ncbi:MAG: peptidoglycan-binding protein [Patescibacteria group bacterium]